MNPVDLFSENRFLFGKKITFFQFILWNPNQKIKSKIGKRNGLVNDELLFNSVEIAGKQRVTDFTDIVPELF